MTAAEGYKCDSCGRRETAEGGGPDAPVCCGLPMRPFDLLYTMENPERPADIGADFVCGVCGREVTLPTGESGPLCCGQPMEEAN
ncbi:hypothetical protein EPN96_03370 [bacterium]|nr:MAG: hypothetical protein EPN96_03370 [bacterium]